MAEAKVGESLSVVSFLPVSCRMEVIAVQRVRRGPEDLKAPICPPAFFSYRMSSPRWKLKHIGYRFPRYLQCELTFRQVLRNSVAGR